MNFNILNNETKKIDYKDQALLLVVVSSIPWSSNLKIKLNVNTKSEKVISDFFKINNIEFEEFSIGLDYAKNSYVIAEFEEKNYMNLKSFDNVFLFSYSQFDENKVSILNLGSISLFFFKKENYHILDINKKLDTILKYQKEKSNLINDIQNLVNKNSVLQNEVIEYKNKYNNLKNHLSYQIGSLLVNETKNLKDVLKTPKNIFDIFRKFKKSKSDDMDLNISDLTLDEKKLIRDFENIVSEYLYHPFKKDENILLENTENLLIRFSSDLIEKKYDYIRDLLISADILFILKNYIYSNYSELSLGFNFKNFESIFQMFYYYGESENKKECFEYILFLKEKDEDSFFKVLKLFLAEIMNILEKNNFSDSFFEKEINVNKLICNKDFTSKYVKSPISLNKFCNDNYYKYLKDNSEDFTCLLGSFLYVVLNKKNITNDLFFEFFKISRAKNKNIFINSIRRYTYEISSLKIDGDLNQFKIDYIIQKELLKEDYLYLSMFGFYPEYIKRMIIEKMETTNIDEDTWYYVKSRFGDNKPLFWGINDTLRSVGLNPVEGFLECVDLQDFYKKYTQSLVSKKYEEFGMISVIMTCYNSNIEFLKLSINSILNQSYQNLEIILVDDYSENSADIQNLLIEIDSEIIKYIKMDENSGPYLCRNKAIKISSGDYIAFQDDDDISHLDRLYYELKYLRENNLKVVYTSNLRFDIGFKLQTDNFDSIYSTGPVTMLFHKSLLEEVGIFKPFKSRGDIAFRKRCERIYGKEMVKQIHIPLYYCLGSKNSLSSSFEFNGNYINLKLIRSIIELDKKPKQISIQSKDIVFGCMATFPAREQRLKQTIINILPQLDHLYIYLNNYESVPQFLKNDKITTILGKNHAGDLRDNGKIYPISELDLNGYCFLFDDDIEYPLDYVNNFISKLNNYDNKVVVGVHGVIFEKPFKNYFENRVVFHFKNENIKDIVVNQLGTGVLAFHTSLMKPNLSKYKEKGMADVFFAIEAKSKNIPLICIEHNENWIKPSIIEVEDNTNLYDEFKRDNSVQTKYIVDAGIIDKESVSNIFI